MIWKVSIYAGLVSFSLTVLYVILFGVPFSLFSYHPLLILIALVSITEGIAGIQSDKISTEKSKTYHGILQGVGFTAMTFGFSVIYYNKDLNNKPHFTSAHGQLGSITYTYMMIQLLMGTLVAYVPSLFGGLARAKKMYKYHRISGYILFVLLWTTTLYGVQTPFLLLNDKLRYIYWTSIASITIGIMFLVQSQKLGFSMKKTN